MLLPQETVPVHQALGRIAAQCLSPCPPGIPILIPGQKITEEVLELISDKTIVVVAQ
jgi:arginine/lysine/ornithine decarboxylase